jgi:Fe(3+) dicitrate transport protein
MLHFAENQFRVTEKFSVTPGVRYEHITSVGQGRFGVSQGNYVPMPQETLVRNKSLLDWASSII